MRDNKTVRLGDAPLENRKLISLFVLTVLLFFAGREAGRLLVSAYPQWSGAVETEVIHLCTAAVLVPYTFTALTSRRLLRRNGREPLRMAIIALLALAVILAADSGIMALGRIWKGGSGALGFGGAPGTGDTAAGSVALMFLAFAVCVPVTEELVFRGVFFAGLRCRCGFAASALLSSILFALMHGFGLSAAAALVTGVVLCYVYEKTDHIAVPVLVHAVNNIIAITVMK